MSDNNKIAVGLSPFSYLGANAAYNAPTYGNASAAINSATSSYDTAAATEKAAILADTSLDSISKQELIAQLAQGDKTIADTGTSNSNTDTEIAQAAISGVQAQVATDKSDDPLYQGRRFLENQYIKQQNMPGSAQTILTARTNTPAGTPTLLTSGPGGSGGVNLTTPGSILTGKTA